MICSVCGKELQSRGWEGWVTGKGEHCLNGEYHKPIPIKIDAEEKAELFAKALVAVFDGSCGGVIDEMDSRQLALSDEYWDTVEAARKFLADRASTQP